MGCRFLNFRLQIHNLAMGIPPTLVHRRMPAFNRLISALVILLIFITPCYPTANQSKDLRPTLVPQWGHDQAARDIVYAPNGRYIVTVGATVLMWNVTSGLLLRRFAAEASHFVCAAISPDGRQVAAGNEWGDVIIWDLESGEEVTRFKGAPGTVKAVDYSPDGALIAAASKDDKTQSYGAINVWKVATGHLLHEFRDKNPFVTVDFSPDGLHLAAGSHNRAGQNGYMANVWDLRTGQLIHSLTGHRGAVTSVSFSPDGKRLITGNQWGPAYLWDTSSGKKLADIGSDEEAGDRVEQVVYSPDGQLLSMMVRSSIRIVELKKGTEIQRFGGTGGLNIFSSAFSPDGRYIACGARYATLIYEIATGNQVMRLAGRTSPVRSVDVSPDGRRILTSRSNHITDIWDLATGVVANRIEGETAVFSPDGRYIATSGHEDGKVRLLDSATARVLRQLDSRPHHESFFHRRFAFSKDGSRLITGGSIGLVWETKSGELYQKLEQPEELFRVVALSPDGRHAVTTGDYVSTWLWNVDKGFTVREFRDEHQARISRIKSIDFSPDGKTLLGSRMFGQVSYLWELSTGKVLRQFEGSDAAFSASGRKILTTSYVNNHVARLWDIDTGRQLAEFVGHADYIESAAFFPDERYVITGSRDYATIIWDATSGKEICRLLSFDDGSWAVFDGTGRFDASNGGDIDGLHWMVGLEAISLSQLKARYYEPGLLSKKLGFNVEPLSEVSAFSSPALFPSIEANIPEGTGSNLAVKLTNRGGGFGKTSIWINGKEVKTDIRPANVDHKAKTLQMDVALNELPNLIAGEENRIEIKAFNAEGYLSSRGVTVQYQAPGQASTDAPTLWAIVVGVSDYRGDVLDLRYAAKDAVDIAQALQLGARRLFGAEQVHMQLLADADVPTARPPTKPELQQAFRKIKSASHRDIIVIYFAGHGITFGDDYYYLTREARSADMSDPAVRGRVAVSGKEMTDWVKQSPALKQVMILDTCAAGAAAKSLLEKRSISSDQVRAIERLKDRTGFHVLMGSAADRVSYEATQFQQGILTHSLLRGMKGAALREDSFVDVSLLFQHAADEVPQLASHVGGIQRPRIAAPRGTSFDIGKLTVDDRQAIALTVQRPILLQPVLQNVDALFDDLGLGAKLRAYLRDASFTSVRSGGETLSAVYVDADQLSGAIRPSGNYKIDGDQITVNLALVKDGKREASIKVVGSRIDLESLTKSMAQALLQAASDV